MARFYGENGGDFTLADFAAYEPIWAEPVHKRKPLLADDNLVRLLTGDLLGFRSQSRQSPTAA